ncbi:hypothetical protein PHJA_001356700 [Phtheirospermum japonicum]|uniref:Uncharacterized protein n=1 Tax=Phtheirospermum japonicum TaxID=374723 RepID=A0A830BZ81_9LAMI|nr:hypothetical protein PHJA_001356700 [Phtheirospermum japonicum]
MAASTQAPQRDSLSRSLRPGALPATLVFFSTKAVPPYDGDVGDFYDRRRPGPLLSYTYYDTSTSAITAVLYNGKEMKNSKKLGVVRVSDGDLVMLVLNTSSSRLRAVALGNEVVGFNPDGSAVNPSAFQQQLRSDSNLMAQPFQVQPGLRITSNFHAQNIHMKSIVLLIDIPCLRISANLDWIGLVSTISRILTFQSCGRKQKNSQ